MAQDNGAGGGGGSFWGAVTQAARGVADLLVELGELDGLRKRVDELLVQLNASEAAPGKVGQDRLQRAQLGGAFTEAEFLYASYDTVHGELENLSTVLGLQIESMSLAIQASGTGHDALDQSIRRRMQTLNAGIDAHYDEKRDPYAHQGGASTGDALTKPSPAQDSAATSGGYGSAPGSVTGVTRR